INTAKHLAFRVLDGQQKFEQSRLNPNEIRYNITHLGNWIEKCEADFERFWHVVTNDFALKLDKSGIYKQAADELAQYNTKYSLLGLNGISTSHALRLAGFFI